MDKTMKSLEKAIVEAGLADGMTISFHHHLRNGDAVLNMVLKTISDLGIKSLKVASSSIFPVHSPLVEHIKNGVVLDLDANYMSGPVADFVSEGGMEHPVTFRTHGGRPRAIETGDLPVDVAFIAAPTADENGNLSGLYGPSACGSLGYAMSDARCAGKVVAVTDNMVDRLINASIDQSLVDFVVKVDSIGDAAGIVSGTTRMPKDPVALVIARYAARAIEASGLLKDGISFQTGAGGASLAAAVYLKDIMIQKGIKGSFGMGGITAAMVSFLEEGLLENLYDVQCFDLDAVRSLRENPNHVEISSSLYAGTHTSGPLVDDLDVVILGATEIDVNFNVNVHTNSSGRIMGGSGGHSDTAAGSKMSIIVAPVMRARLPIVVDEVTVISTPGKTVDVLVTERGIAVNPLRPDLEANLRSAGLPVVSIGELRKKAIELTGVPAPIKKGEKTVAYVKYRDGVIIDEIKSLA